MSVRYIDRMPMALASIRRKRGVAIRQVLNDVTDQSEPKTPKRVGELRQRVLKVVQGDRGRITWQAGHAAVQEKGRRRGARPFSKYTTPGTGAHYAENAVKKVASAHGLAVRIRSQG